jgi:hypothetical protein
VASGYRIADAACHALGKKCVSEAAGFLFQVALAGWERRDVEWESETICQRSNECFVGVRFRAPQAVIHVEDGGRDTQFRERRQEKNRVSASRYGDADILVPGERCADAINHILILTNRSAYFAAGSGCMTPKM